MLGHRAGSLPRAKEILVRIKASLLTLAGALAGVVAAVAAYQSAAGASAATTPPHASATRAAQASVTWLPCAKGWRLKGETCVRIKERVVVVHDLPAPFAGSSARTSAPTSTARRSYAAAPASPTRTSIPVPPSSTPTPYHEVEVEHSDGPEVGADR